MARYFSVDERWVSADAANRQPSWNVAPTDQVRVVALVDSGDDKPHRALNTARWGLVPAWSKDLSIGTRMINARAETAAEKPSFAKALAARRCLVPADAYYEWHTDPATKAKQPYAIRPTSGEPFAFAGIYEVWRDRNATDPDRGVVTVAIITAAATGDLATIHDRRPLALPPDDFGDWLDPDTPSSRIAQLLGTAAPACDIYPVSTRVGNVRNNDADLLKPL